MSLFRGNHRASAYTQLPSAASGKVPKDLEDALPNFDLFAFPGDIKIGAHELEIDDLLAAGREDDAAKVRAQLLAPHQHSFVGTLGDGQRIYGHCYRIMVPFPSTEEAEVRRIIQRIVERQRSEEMDEQQKQGSPSGSSGSSSPSTSSITGGPASPSSASSHRIFRSFRQQMKMPSQLYEPLCFCVLTRLPFHDTFAQAVREHMEMASPMPVFTDLLMDGAEADMLAAACNLHRLQVRKWAAITAREMFTKFNTHTPVPDKLAPPDPVVDADVSALLQSLAPAYPHIRGRQYLDSSATYPALEAAEKQKGTGGKGKDSAIGGVPRLPLMDIDLGVLFRNLCPRNVLRVLRAVLMDQKMVFITDNVEDLLPTIEAISGLLYPFDCHTIPFYSPVVPIAIVRDGNIFQMPFQFVMGMEKRALKYVDGYIEPDVCRVDLVSNTVWQGNDEDYPPLPTNLMLKLYSAYHRYGGFMGGAMLKHTLESTPTAAKEKAAEHQAAKSAAAASGTGECLTTESVNGGNWRTIAAPDVPADAQNAAKVLALSVYVGVLDERGDSER